MRVRRGAPLAQELLIAAALIAFLALVMKAFGGTRMVDFRGGMYNAATAILHGVSPYRTAFLGRQAAAMRAGHVAIGELHSNSFSVPLYPAFANLLIVPLSLLSFGIAAVIWTLLSAVSLVVGLRLLGVRDQRCLLVSLISWPVLTDLGFGSISCFLFLGAATAWHWRERVLRPALAIAAVIAVRELHGAAVRPNCACFSQLLARLGDPGRRTDHRRPRQPDPVKP